MTNKRFYRDSRKEVIAKAYHLLNAFDYDHIKKKEIVPLETGCNAAGRLDYILCTTTQWLFDYKFTYDPYYGWKFQTYLREKPEVA